VVGDLDFIFQSMNGIENEALRYAEKYSGLLSAPRAFAVQILIWRVGSIA